MKPCRKYPVPCGAVIVEEMKSSKQRSAAVYKVIAAIDPPLPPVNARARKESNKGDGGSLESHQRRVQIRLCCFFDNENEEGPKIFLSTVLLEAPLSP
nr:hypothetical protein [Tanacetum cinerariifolium]